MVFRFLISIAAMSDLSVFHSSGVDQSPARGRWDAGAGTIIDTVEAPSLGPVYLLKLPKVRSELRLTEDQWRRLAEGEKRRDEYFYAELSRRDLFDASTEAGKLRNDEFMAEFRGRIFSDLKMVLSDGQIRRLSEITVQLLGPFAVADPIIQQQLNVSPDLATEIREITGRYKSDKDILRTWFGREEQRLFAQARKEDPKVDMAKSRNQPPFSTLYEDYWARLKKLRSEAAIKILRRLTRRQKERLKSLEGEPFEMISELREPGSATLLNGKERSPKQASPPSPAPDRVATKGESKRS